MTWFLHNTLFGFVTRYDIHTYYCFFFFLLFPTDLLYCRFSVFDRSHCSGVSTLNGYFFENPYGASLTGGFQRSFEIYKIRQFIYIHNILMYGPDIYILYRIVIHLIGGSSIYRDGMGEMREIGLSVLTACARRNLAQNVKAEFKFLKSNFVLSTVFFYPHPPLTCSTLRHFQFVCLL